jgi:hypothetical protein
MTTLTDVEEELSDVDRDALDRAIDICRTKKDPADREQIERKLATEPWREVGEFAAYSCQMDSLHLQPWQSPPCWVDDLVSDIQGGPDGVGGDYEAARLLRRLLDAGLSRYEPDPIAALKAKKRPPRPSR